MGKIRVKTLGDEETELKEQKEKQRKKEEKKLAKAPGLKGGQRVVAVGPTEEEIEKATPEPQKKEPIEEKSKKKSYSSKKVTKQKHSRRYQKVLSLVDRNKKYLLKDALELLPKMTLAKFDETVELHINTIEQGISGNLTLPHGTGKKTRVVIADDKTIADIEKGKIEFDILVAVPQMMPKLARVAKILGPRGLMPNPKNGTITDKPEEVAKKYAGGQIRFKTEAKAPVIHLTVGKVSFGTDKLADNIRMVIQSITQGKIKNITLKSTMSPGIKITLE